MKVEELTQDKLDSLLSKFEALEESNKGLKSDLVKLKVKAKGADIDPEDYANLQNQVAELSSKLENDGKLSKKELDRLSGLVKEKDTALTTYLIDANLTDALAKSGVKPELMDAAKALLKMQATIKAENGNYQAMIGDRVLGEAVKDWSISETGKHFRPAENNSGGGAQGGNNNSQSKTITRSEFDAKSQYERATLAKDGFKVVD
jgi:hypothetical protein